MGSWHTIQTRALLAGFLTFFLTTWPGFAAEIPTGPPTEIPGEPAERPGGTATVPRRGLPAPEATPVLDWEMGVAISHSEGDYEADSPTKITYVPLSIRRLYEDGDVSFTIPYLTITSPGTVILVGGTPNPIGEQLSDFPVTEGGLGDLLLRGRYYVVDEEGLIPTVALSGRVKFPTAAVSKGLGTGEFDVGFGTEISKTLVGNWIGFFDFFYTFIGDPPDIDFNNQWFLSPGIGYYFTPNLLGSVFYDEWRTLLPENPNPKDLFFSLNYYVTPTLRVYPAVEVGLNNAAPDYGITWGTSVLF